MTFTPDPCCHRPSIANMDHPKGLPPDTVSMVNRCCTHCWTHWYGPEGAVARYSKAEWDALMAKAFDEDLAAARAA